jgi:hypothetical protein
MSDDTQSKQAVAVREKHHYDAIVLREFRSSIPPHLLANLPDDERFMVETMSKLENQYGWLADGLVRNNTATLDLDERVTALEKAQKDASTRLVAMEKQEDKVEKLWDWKQFFSGKWAILAALVLVLLPLLLKFLLDLVIKWLKI